MTQFLSFSSSNFTFCLVEKNSFFFEKKKHAGARALTLERFQFGELVARLT